MSADVRINLLTIAFLFWMIGCYFLGKQVDFLEKQIEILKTNQDFLVNFINKKIKEYEINENRNPNVMSFKKEQPKNSDESKNKKTNNYTK